MFFYFVVFEFESMCFSIFYFFVFGYSSPLTLGFMAPFGRKSYLSTIGSTHATKDSMEETNFYNINVSNEEQEDIDMV